MAKTTTPQRSGNSVRHNPQLPRPSMDDLDRLRANILAREAAEIAIEKLAKERDGAGVDEKRFWEAVAREAAARCGYRLEIDMKDEVLPLSEAEAQKFLDFTLQYGVHAGRRVRDIPTSYWISITEGDFFNKVRRFMKTPHFKALQDAEAE